MQLPSPSKMLFRVDFLLWRRAGDEAKENEKESPYILPVGVYP